MKRLSQKDFIFLLLFSFLFFATRILLTFSPFVKQEEREIGAIANEILDNGFRFNFTEYSGGPYNNVNLLEAILNIPFILIFGRTYFAIQLYPMFLSYFCFILTFLFLLKFINDQSHIYFSLIYIFSPFIIVRSNINTWSHHLEGTFFSILIFIVFINSFSKKEKYTLRLFGLIAGFAYFWHFGTLISSFTGFLIFPLFLSSYIGKNKLSLRDYLQYFQFFLFFLLGYLPGIFISVKGSFLIINSF